MSTKVGDLFGLHSLQCPLTSSDTSSSGSLVLWRFRASGTDVGIVEGSLANDGPLCINGKKGAGMVSWAGWDGHPSASSVVVTVVAGSKVELHTWGTHS